MAVELKITAVPRGAFEAPIIACFPGGAPNRAIDAARAAANGEAETDTDPFTVKLHAPDGGVVSASASSSSSSAAARARSARSHRVLIGDTPHVGYTGTNYGEKAHHQAYFHRYAIGVVSTAASAAPNSVTVQLLDVPHVYVMSQTVKGVAQAENDENDQKKQALDAAKNGKDAKTVAMEKFATDRKQLVESFGSRKRQRTFRSEEAGAVKLTKTSASMGALDAALTEQPKTAADSSDDDSDAAGGAAAAAAGGTAAGPATGVLSTVLPPYDEKTTDHTKIYDFNTMLSADARAEAAADHTFATLLKNPTTLSHANNVSAYGAYVMSLASVLSAKTVPQRKAVLPVLTYVSQLLHFHSLDPRKKEAGLKHAAWGESTKEAILNSFTVSVAGKSGDGRMFRTTTDTTRDRLLCHVAICSLMVTAYELPHSSVLLLAQQLKIAEPKMGEYFREIGCLPSGKGPTRVWTLKAPLQLSTLRKSRAKPKR